MKNTSDGALFSTVAGIRAYSFTEIWLLGDCFCFLATFCVLFVLSAINKLIILYFQKQLLTSETKKMSKQQRKWYLAEAVTTQTCFPKKIILKYQAKLTEKHLCWSLFLSYRPVTLYKKILMNRCFPVNGCKYLWMAASDFGKSLTTLTIIFDSVEYIWNFDEAWLTDDPG